MTKVAKLVIIDGRGKYLLLYRNDHPFFGNDPDLPGGIVEKGESPIEGLVREINEEVGITISKTLLKPLYEGTKYSHPFMHYSLYVAQLDHTPDVELSWEHGSYEWLGKDDFLYKAQNAKDSYMHMVHTLLTRQG